MDWTSRKLPACNDNHTETICNIMGSLLNSNRKTPIDLTDTSQSGWVWATFGVFTPLCLLGIFGNILTIVMFSKYIKKTTTSVFIIALAIVDLIVCSFSMPLWLASLLTSTMDSDFLCRGKKLIDFLAVPLSGSILLVIAIDRFLLIFLVRTDIVTKFRAKIIILALAVICAGVAIPNTLSYSTLHEVAVARLYCEGKVFCSVQECRMSEAILDKSIHKTLWLGLNITFILMVLAFMTFYFLIFIKVYAMYRKMSNWKARNSGGNTSKSYPDKQLKKIDVDHATFASQHQSNQHNVESAPLAKESGVKVDQEGEKQHSESDPPVDTDQVNLMKSNTPPKLDNLGVSAAVKRRKKKRLPHAQTAITLCLVTVSFVVAYSPLVVMMFTGVCMGEVEDGSAGDAGKYFNCPKNSFLMLLWNFFYLNHIINPIIYSFLNPRFKEALKACWCRRKDS